MQFGELMSKIGKIPITIKEGITINFEENLIKVSGPKGELSFKIPNGIKAQVLDDKVIISQEIPNDDETRALFGLTRASIANMVKGVSEGFEKKLELSGVGYRAQADGSMLTLHVGFSHPVIVKDDNVRFSVSENVITISGIDKILVGDMASKIRSVRPPEPYKGKGIKYQNEKIRRKAGKAAKALGAAAGAK